MFKGDMVRALDDFTRALQLDPKIAWAYFNRGLLWVYLGEDERAQRDFTECLRLKPELKAELELRAELAKHLRRIGQPPE